MAMRLLGSYGAEEGRWKGRPGRKPHPDVRRLPTQWSFLESEAPRRGHRNGPGGFALKLHGE